jgi:pimeloyl-ACP methyl ester carboxylesterase
LFGLLPEGAAIQPPAEAEALDLIRDGRHEQAARTFIEHVVMGPGSWAQLPPIRKILVGNAPTFLEERADPDAARADLDALVRSGVPLRITLGRDGDPSFRAVADRIAAAVPGAAVDPVPGGHAPHITHPAALVKSLTNWIGDTQRAAGVATVRRAGMSSWRY